MPQIELRQTGQRDRSSPTPWVELSGFAVLPWVCSVVEKECVNVSHLGFPQEVPAEAFCIL